MIDQNSVRASNQKRFPILGLPEIIVRHWSAVFLIGLLGYLLFSLATLDITPAPAGDEGWFAQVMEDTRKGCWPAHSRVLGILGMEKDTVIHGRIYVALGALAGAVLKPSLKAQRFLSFLSICTTLLFMYLWLNQLYGNRQARAAVVLFTISIPVFIASHMGRPEAVVLAFASAAFYFAYRSFTTGSQICSWASGILIGLGMDVHLGAALLSSVLASWWLMEYKGSLFRKKQFWAWIFGVMAGIFWWFLVHVLVSPELFFRQWSVLAGTELNAAPYAKSLNPLVWVRDEILAIGRPYIFSRFGLGYVSLATFAACILVGLWRREKHDRQMLLSLFVLFLMQAVFSQNKYGWYTVYYLLFLCPLIARISEIPILDGMKKRMVWRTIGIALIVFYLFTNITQVAGKAWLDLKEPPLIDYAQAIFAEIPQEAHVLASSTIYFLQPPFAWVDTDFLKILPYTEYQERNRLGRNIQEAVRRARIDYIIAQSDHDTLFASLNDDREFSGKPSSLFDRSHFIKHYTKLLKVVDAGRKGQYVIRQVLPGEDKK
jgi:hypothetical protein